MGSGIVGGDEGIVDAFDDRDAAQCQHELLSFGEAFDWYARVIYDADAVAEGVASTLRRVGAGRVLDCAAGSGLPALQLHQRYGQEDGRLYLNGPDRRDAVVDLVCSDGSQTMIDQFHRNAKAMALDVQCDLVDWNELSAEPGGRYDFVLCRGNSLVYAATWDGGDTAADLTAVEQCLRSFGSVLRPGGLLQVDAPRFLALQPETKQAVRTYEHVDAKVEVIEEVTETCNGRHWVCTVNVEPHYGWPKTCTFERHSAKMTIEDVALLLDRSNFETVETFQLDGDRPGHQTILARYLGS